MNSCTHGSKWRLSTTWTAGLTAFLTWSSSAIADVIVDWNAKAYELLPSVGITNGPRQSAVAANIHIAQHDALNAIDPMFAPYAYSGSFMPGASKEAAVHAAARSVLVGMFPSLASSVDAHYVPLMAAIPDGASKLAGISVGNQAAAAILAFRADDPFFKTPRPTYTWPAPGPGVFQPMPPDFNPNADAALFLSTGKLYALRHARQFEPGIPPDLTSAEWAGDYNEVKEVGRQGSTTRTPDQTDAAWFFLEGSTSAVVNRAARPVVASQNLDLARSARIMALMNMTMTDSAISVFTFKYDQNFWRPVTAIRQGDTDFNEATQADTTWLPESVTTPQHPEYPAGHPATCMSGMQVVMSLVGNDIPLTTTTTTAREGRARSCENVEAFAEECGEARIWFGVHFRNTVRDSQHMGKQIARWVMRKQLLPLKGNGLTH